MKQLEVAVARGQDPWRLYKSELFLKLLAEQNEEISKVVRMFDTWRQSGDLEDLKKLRRELRKIKDSDIKLANARISYCGQFGDWSNHEHRLAWFCTAGSFKYAEREADDLVKEAMNKEKEQKK